MRLPLLRACFCVPDGRDLGDTLEPEWKQNKIIVLRPGETFTISMPNKGRIFGHDLFAGKDSFDYGRWALVFGVPDGEDPNKYVVGTVLTKTVRWQLEKGRKIDNLK